MKSPYNILGHSFLIMIHRIGIIWNFKTLILDDEKQ